MFRLSPKFLAEQLGFGGDPESIELLTAFYFAFDKAADKKEFLKESIRRALTEPDGSWSAQKKRGGV